MSKYRYQYLISATHEGGIEVLPTDVNESPEEVAATPTIQSILDSSKKLVSDLERQLVVDAVIQNVSSLLNPPEAPTQSEVITEALAERGITLPEPDAEATDTSK